MHKVLTIFLGTTILSLHSLVGQSLNSKPFESFEFSSQFFFQQAFYNPAYAGHWSQPNVWLGRSSARIDTSRYDYIQFNIQETFDDYNSGVGLTFNHQKIKTREDTRQFLIGAQYSYGFEFAEKHKGRFGIQAGLLHLDKEERLLQGPTGTATFNSINENYFKINLDLGFLIEMGSFQLGASILHTNEPQFSFVERTVASGASVEQKNTYRRQSILQALYEIKIGKKFYVQPAVLLRTPLQSGSNVSQFSGDFGVLVNYNDTFMSGFQFRTGNNFFWGALSLAARVKNSYQLSFSVDFAKGSFKRDPQNQFQLGLAWYWGWVDEVEEIEE